MAKKIEYATTIAIDTRDSTVHYYSMGDNDQSSIIHSVKSYSGIFSDEEFYKSFKEIIAEFAAETPSASIRKVSLVLPDCAVALDTVNVPTMRTKSATENALNLALGEIYKNYTDLKISYFQAMQNKQNTVYNTAAIQKTILSGIYSACSQNKMLVDMTTFAASSTVTSASLLSPKLKTATYLLLDIKDSYSRFIFVVNGRAVGFYTIPFGLDFLDGKRFVQEDMLFDHSFAALKVLEARENAKAKKMSGLSSRDDDTVEQHDAVDDEADLTDETDFLSEYDCDLQAGTAVKMPRKLPSFMERPLPLTEKEIANENFRVFVKWALSLLKDNVKIFELGAPEFICVNIPTHLEFVLDVANQHKEENGIEFCALDMNDVSREVRDNLELYGGLFPKAINKCAKF